MSLFVPSNAVEDQLVDLLKRFKNDGGKSWEAVMKKHGALKREKLLKLVVNEDRVVQLFQSVLRSSNHSSAHQMTRNKGVNESFGENSGTLLLSIMYLLASQLLGKTLYNLNKKFLCNLIQSISIFIIENNPTITVAAIWNYCFGILTMYRLLHTDLALELVPKTTYARGSRTVDLYCPKNDQSGRMTLIAAELQILEGASSPLVTQNQWTILAYAVLYQFFIQPASETNNVSLMDYLKIYWSGRQAHKINQTVHAIRAMSLKAVDLGLCNQHMLPMGVAMFNDAISPIDNIFQNGISISQDNDNNTSRYASSVGTLATTAGVTFTNFVQTVVGVDGSHVQNFVGIELRKGDLVKYYCMTNISQ